MKGWRLWWLISGRGFIFAGSLEKEYWQSPLSAVNSSFVRLKHSYLTVPVRRRDENKVFTWWKDEDCDDLYRGGVFIFAGSLRKGVLTITAVCSKLIFRKVKTQLSHHSSQESNCKMYLFKFQNVFVKLQNVFVQISKSICQNCKMYLFKFQKVFVTNSTLLPLLLLRPEKLNIAIAIAIKNWILPLLLCPEKLNMAIAIAASWKMHLT